MSGTKNCSCLNQWHDKKWVSRCWWATKSNTTWKINENRSNVYLNPDPIVSRSGSKTIQLLTHKMTGCRLYLLQQTFHKVYFTINNVFEKSGTYFKGYQGYVSWSKQIQKAGVWSRPGRKTKLWPKHWTFTNPKEFNNLARKEWEIGV